MRKDKKSPSSKKGQAVALKKTASFFERSQGFWEQKSPVVRFVLAFGACLGLFYVFYLSGFFVEYIEPTLTKTQATAGRIILNLLGQETTSSNAMISGNSFSVNIKKGCDGLEPLAMLLSGILVFPIGFRWKWRGLIFGALALLFLNQVRIVMLYFAGLSLSTEVFEWLHLQGGFVIFTALVVMIWITWANWAMKASQSPSSVTT